MFLNLWNFVRGHMDFERADHITLVFFANGGR